MAPGIEDIKKFIFTLRFFYLNATGRNLSGKRCREICTKSTMLYVNWVCKEQNNFFVILLIFSQLVLTKRMLKASLSVFQVITQFAQCLEIAGNKQLHLEAGSLKIDVKSALKSSIENPFTHRKAQTRPAHPILQNALKKYPLPHPREKLFCSSCQDN